MPIDEATAYALAAWERLDQQVSDDALRAVCGGFALVAVADGDLDERETERFMRLVRQQFDAFPGLDLDRVESHFRDLTQALLTDPEAGHARALEEVACVAGKPRESELVRTAARVAMIADERLDPGEARVLDEIKKILG